LEPGLIGGLEVTTLGRSRFSIAGWQRLRAMCRQAEVIVAHGSSTLPAVAAATAGLSSPFVYRSIGDPRAWANTRARRIRVRAAAARGEAVVALWRGAAVAWLEELGVPAERLQVIPNGSDPERFKPADQREREEARDAIGVGRKAPVAMYLGALTPEKRVELAIRAVSELPSVTLVIVGDGPRRTSLEEAAREHGGGRIRFLGRSDRPESLLAAADVVVLPSDTEGMPAVAIEAGLAGVPVVATRVGGLHEIVISGQTGVLVAPGRASGLVTGIQACLQEREPMGLRARVHCERSFDSRRLAHMWRDLLETVITA
jgi:glycosyltransferase involved in cell wall biosynthesis